MAEDPHDELREITHALRLHLEEWSDLAFGESTHLPGADLLSSDVVAALPTAAATAPVQQAPSTALKFTVTPAKTAQVTSPPALREATQATVATNEPSARDEGPVSIADAFAKGPSKAKANSGNARPLDVIRTEVASCTKCGLAATRTNTVFERGNPNARLCFIGEAPGADEDAQGLPFVGRAGQLLDKMIGAMGLDPEKDVYICNIIKCRPPENRKPTAEETATCFPYLHEQLANVAPQVIVALGNTAVQALLETKVGISKMRGQWKLYRGKTLVMPTYHPSYLLRPSSEQANAKREAWEDLQAVMKELGLALPKRKG